MNDSILIEIAGWLGVTALLMAYGLISTGKVQGNSVTYQLLNMLGSVLLIVNSFYYGAYPSVGVNVAWVGIAIYALTKGRTRTIDKE